GNLLSLAFGSMDNTLRFEGDSERMAQVVPELVALPILGDRVAVCVVDALVGQYEGETKGLLHYSMALNQVWLSKDPVALDVLALEELGRLRKSSGSSVAKSEML